MVFSRKLMDKNQILKILNNWRQREDIQDILSDFNLPYSGKKEELLKLIIQNRSIFERAVLDLVNDLYKDELQELCDDCNLSTTGTVRELKERILKSLLSLSKESISKIEASSGISLSTTKSQNNSNNLIQKSDQELEELNITVRPGRFGPNDRVIRYYGKRIKFRELAEIFALLCKIEDAKHPKPKYEGSDMFIKFLNEVKEAGTVTDAIAKKYKV